MTASDNECPIELRPSLATMARYRPGRPATATDGPPPVKLSANEAASELAGVADAVVAASVDLRHYPDPNSTALRSAIAAGFGVDTGSVMVGCGSVGLIQQLLLAFTSRGDVVVSPWISFEAYPILCRLADADLVTVPLDGQTADLSALGDAVDEHRAKAVLLADPNNPTGTSVDPSDLDRFLDRVDRSTLVVLDQAYAEYVTPDRRARPIADLIAAHPNVVVLRTFSKAFALAGLRVGYGLASPALIAAANAAALPFAVGSVTQAAAIDAWSRRADVERRCAAVVSQRIEMEQRLRDCGYEVPVSEANFVWLPTSDTAAVGGALDAAGLVTRVFDGVGVRITIADPEVDDRVVATLADLSSHRTRPEGDGA